MPLKTDRTQSTNSHRMNTQCACCCLADKLAIQELWFRLTTRGPDTEPLRFTPLAESPFGQ